MGRIFLPGTVCDLVERRWLDNPEPGMMVEMVDTIFNEIVEKGEHKIHWKGNPLTDQKNVQAYCRKAVSRLEPWLLEHVVPFDYDAEVKFKAYMSVPYICDGVQAPVQMGGGIDIVVRDDAGKFHLYDLKITEASAYIRSTLAQLTFYDLAWSVIYGGWDTCVEWAFVTPMLEEATVPITVETEDRRVMLSRIVKYAQGVWTDSWDPKSDDVGCQWCTARDVCDKFKVIQMQDENGKQRVSFAQAAAQRSKFRT